MIKTSQIPKIDSFKEESNACSLYVKQQKVIRAIHTLEIDNHKKQVRINTFMKASEKNINHTFKILTEYGSESKEFTKSIKIFS